MPEEDVDFPLWDDRGLLPDEPDLLAAGLGISPDLVEELRAWGGRWNAARRALRSPSDRLLEELIVELGSLASRLRSELGDAFPVVVENL